MDEFREDTSSPSSDSTDDTTGEVSVAMNSYSKQMTTKASEYSNRDYQIVLCEMARKENLVICLPTGSGKTYIALKLTQLYYLPEAIKNNKTIVFLANSIPLVNQQANYFRDHLEGYDAKSGESMVKPITGEQDPDSWSRDKWKEVLDSTKVLVMPPAVLQTAVNKSKVHFQEINLLIIDECHHATKNHPMATIMKDYAEKNKKFPDYPLPRVIGLTATLSNGKCNMNEMKKEVESIEHQLCGRAVTYKNYAIVLQHSTNAQIKVSCFDSPMEDPLWKIELCGIIAKLNGAESYLLSRKDDMDCKVQKAMKTVKHKTLKDKSQLFTSKNKLPEEIIKSFTDPRNMMQDKESLGIYAGRLCTVLKKANLPIVKCNDEKMTRLITEAEKILTEVIDSCDKIMSRMNKGQQIETFVSKKVQKLFEILVQWQLSIGKNEELCGIVFCKEKVTAQILSWILEDAREHCGEKYKFIRPAFVVGSSGVKNDLLEQKVNLAKYEETISKFRSKEVNLLVATNVLEEGIDVPACNIVIRFDKVETYPSFVQSMGRARKKGALFCVLTSNQLTTQQEILKFETYGCKLASYLIENGERHLVGMDGEDKEVNPSDDNIKFVLNPDDPDSPKFTLYESVQWVYNYCHILSKNRIDHLLPFSWWEKVEHPEKTMYKAYVKLPMTAAISDIVEGSVMESKEDAKRSAFFQTCKLLYAANVFDENLSPRVDSIPSEVATYVNSIKGSATRDGKKVGSKKNALWYPKQIPDVMFHNDIKADEELHVYWIKVSLVQLTSESTDWANFYQTRKCSNSFGVITKINLDEFQLKDDPVKLYGRHGVFECRLIRITMKKCPIFTKQELESIKMFHHFIFSETLKINHPLFEKSQENAVFIVALKDNMGWEINWNLYERVTSFNPVLYNTPLNEDERGDLSWKEEEFHNAVVVPWHRNESSLQLYCVSSIRNDLTAESYMNEEKSYGDHYRNKWGLNVVKTNQPFLHCLLMGSQLNYFITKKPEDKKSEDQERSKSSGEILIAEFVRVYPLPAELLVEAQFLASIMHRITRLLLSRQIQLSIAEQLPQWKAALELNVPSSPICNGNLNGTDQPSPNKYPKMDCAYGDVGSSMQQVLYKKPCKENSEKQAEIVYKDFVHVEFMHPEKITAINIDAHKKWKFGERVKASSSGAISMQMSLTPVRGQTEKTYELIPRAMMEFKSIDAATDFSTNPGPTPADVMEALTLSNAQDCMSLESLEVIGDSVLKLFVSTHIFCEFPSFNEGQMTELRNELVSNAYLFEYGKKRQIGEYLSGGMFIPDYSWLPPGVSVPAFASNAAVKCGATFDLFKPPMMDMDVLEKMSEADLMHHINNCNTADIKRGPAHTTFTHSKLGDKSISDCVEALIGTYYMKAGLDGALRFLDWLGVSPPDANGKPVKYKRFDRPERNINDSIKSVEDFVPLLNDIETVLDYKFNDKWLLVEALTHPGFLDQTLTNCYQRLEFIGDAVLDFLVTNHIYTNNIRKTPGELTDLRSALVNNVTFGTLAVRYKFHNSLLLISDNLHKAIDKFVKYQKDNGNAVTGHFAMLNDLETPMAVDIHVPKVLGDIFESIVGAVFMDSNMSLDITWTVVFRLMKNEIDIFSKDTPKSPVRELGEMFPGLKFNNQKKLSNGLTVVSVIVKEKELFGSGMNKSQAKQAVAKYALSLFKKR